MKLLKPLAISCALWCGVAFNAQAVSLEKVKESGTLSVALYKDFPPYSYVEKGKQKGIDVEIAKALAEKLSVSASIRMVGADENVGDDLRNNVWKGHYLGGGVADVMLHMPYDREYAKEEDMVSFIAPYQLEKLVFAVNTEKLGDQPTVASLLHVKTGVEIDTLSDFYLLRAMNGKIAEKVVHFKSVSEAMAALKKGDVAAVMAPRGEIQGGLEDAAENIAVREMVTPGLGRTSWAMGAAVKAKYKNLSAAVDKAMGELVEEGKIKEIFAKYKVTYLPPAERMSASN